MHRLANNVDFVYAVVGCSQLFKECISRMLHLGTHSDWVLSEVDPAFSFVGAVPHTLHCKVVPNYGKEKWAEGNKLLQKVVWQFTGRKLLQILSALRKEELLGLTLPISLPDNVFSCPPLSCSPPPRGRSCQPHSTGSRFFI